MFVRHSILCLFYHDIGKVTTDILFLGLVFVLTMRQGH